MTTFERIRGQSRAGVRVLKPLAAQIEEAGRGELLALKGQMMKKYAEIMKKQAEAMVAEGKRLQKGGK